MRELGKELESEVGFPFELGSFLTTRLDHGSLRPHSSGCESRGCRPGLPVPNKPYGFCGR